jgi:DNA modification methylase
MQTRCETTLSINYLPTIALADNPRNARTHSKRQVQQIANSIRSFGFVNSVLIDRQNTIIAGHGRVAAAKLLGMTEVPTVRLESLTDEQIRAYVIADNRLAEKAGWDQSILAIEFQHLLTLDCGIDVTLTGFEMPEIDLLMDEQAKPPDPDDEIPSVATGPAVTREGDLWILGKHKIQCGNALFESSYVFLMGRRRAGVVIADPPYNLKIDGNVSGKGSIRHPEFAMASGEMTTDEYIAFLTDSLRLIAQHSMSGSVHFIFVDWRHLQELLAAGHKVYETLLNLCVWVKDNGGMGSFYRSRHEMILVFKSGKEKHRNHVQLGRFGRNRTNVWQYPGLNTLSRHSEEGNLLALHPTVKPVALVADALLDCSDRGDIVLDSFLGSGSTLIAAERVGRICRGVEIEPRYVDVPIRRWQNYTGDDAIQVSTGRKFNEIAEQEGAIR